MKIPKYWSRRDFTVKAADGYPVTRSALGWSFVSKAEADEMAVARAERHAVAAERMEFGGSEYYSVIPIREPLLQTVSVGEESVGLVTRNRYGCRVLNTDRVLFADIDLWWQQAERPPKGLLGTISSWFRRSQRAVGGGALQEAEAMEQVLRWQGRTGIAARVYRTFAGLRLMVVDRQCGPLEGATTEILETLKSDPLYVQLTRRQECFRARLTPKPWRIGIRTPWYPSAIDHPDYADQLARWAQPYEKKAAEFSVCRLVHALGEPASDPVIRAIVEVHDEACVNGEKPLA